MVKPKIGLTVHYLSTIWEGTQRTDKSECHAAIITKVYDDGSADLKLFGPGGEKPAAAIQRPQDETKQVKQSWHALDSCDC